MRKREGIEPRHKHTPVDADVVCNTEGNTKEGEGHGFGGSTGV